MERIYFNLLSNAVKYTPENGKIVVKLEAETTNYRFSVFNSGSHISPKEVDAIFERFYQIDGHQGRYRYRISACPCLRRDAWRTDHCP